MKKQIELAFPVVIQNGCLETVRNRVFYVFDTPERNCEIHHDPFRTIHFTVENPRAKEIHFLKIDHCLFSEKDQPRCDFAIFDSKCFCFIEIKGTERPAQRSKRLREARQQLLATITTFQAKLTFTMPRIEAYTCIGSMQDETGGSFPAKKATDIEVVLDFEQVGVVLYERGNRKKFK